MRLTELPREEWHRRLLIILNPKRSKLRPWLALMGLRNHLLHRQGRLTNNNPSIQWYARQLARADISQNYWGIRSQLRAMARMGIFREERNQRPVANPLGTAHRLTKAELCEFYLEPRLIPALHRALTHIFKVESLDPLIHSIGEIPNQQTNSSWSLSRGSKATKESQHRASLKCWVAPLLGAFPNTSGFLCWLAGSLAALRPPLTLKKLSPSCSREGGNPI